jgi:DNA-binding transcriptional LysR family regulator
MLAEADAAVEAVEFARAEPRGVIRVSCPVAIAQTWFASIVPDFLAKYPSVRLLLHVSNRRVDLLNEGFDVAFRVRTHPTGEDGVVMRSFGEASEQLVATPTYLDRVGRPSDPKQLADLATLAYDPESERQTWELRGPNGAVVQVDHSPRMVSHDFILLRAAALAGLGIARLPETVVREDLEKGALERVLPQWNTPQGTMHLVFASRRGLLPAVRVFIDFVAETFPRFHEQCRGPAVNSR